MFKRIVRHPGTLLAILASCLLLFVWPVQAAECTWSQATGDWSDPANWSGCGGGVPGVGDTAVISAGQVNISSDITVSGLHFSGGVLNGPGVTTTLTATDSLLLDGGEKSVAHLTLVNAGSGQWTSGSWRLRLPSGGSTWGQFHNASGATFTVSGGVGLINSSNETLRIVNDGTLIKIGGGLADFNSSFVPMVNRGVVEVQQGQLRLPGGNATDPHEGSFTVTAGARIEFAGHRHHFHPDSSVTGAGEVRFPGNGAWTLQAGMTYEVEGLTRVSDATSCPCRLRINTDAFTGSLHMQSGSGKFIEGINGSLTVADTFDWHTGAIGQQFATGNFTLNVLGGITLHSGPSVIAQRGIVNHYGTAVYESGTFYIRHPTARFVNHPDANFEIQGERLLSYRLGGSDPVHGVFDNQGSLIKTGTEAAIIEGIAIENSGVIDVQEGSLRFTRHASLSQPWEGARLILNDGVVHSQAPLMFENSRIYGHGVINADVEIDNAIFLGFGADGSYEAGIVQINGNLTLTDTSQLYARLVSADPQPGVGYGQLRINGDSPTELRGYLAIHIDSEFVDAIQVGDEFVVMTCSQGCTRFFDQVQVTVPDPSDIYFQPFYQGNQVMIRALDEPPPPEDGIVGLQAANSGPVFAGESILFSAAVSEGSNVFYFWQFGDGGTANGSHVDHIYAAAGVYTATVTAVNPASSATFNMPVTIWERPNFAGLVWYDGDGDGRLGLGETGLAGVSVTAVGPGGNLQDSSDGDGRYRIDTETSGWYDLNATLAGHRATSEAPLSLPLPAQGSAVADFGLITAPAAGQGRIVGRAWADADADDFPDLDETSFNGLTVTLWQNGAQIGTTTTDSNGLYAFNNLAPGSYAVQSNAPGGYFPATLVVDAVAVSANQVSSALLGFLPGGTIGGSVVNSSGQGLNNVVLQLEQPNGTALTTTTTSSSGGYQFGPLPPGDYTVRLLPPALYFPADGELTRQLTVGSGFHTQDWTLYFLGRLTINARHSYFSQATGFLETPVGGVEFTVSHESGSSETHTTGPDGLIQLDALTPGLYTITPNLTTLPPETTVNPGERTAVIADNTAASVIFGINPDQAMRTICIRGLLNNFSDRFDCVIEIRVLEDDQGTAPGTLVYEAAARGYHTVIGLAAGSYEVRLIPDEASWPVYQENVILAAETTTVVNYPYNPTPNVSDMRGYAFLDANSSGTRQCSLGECNDPEANGLTVTLYDADYNLVASTETEQLNSAVSGYFRFPNLAAGNYRAVIEMPSGYFPTTATTQERQVTLQVGVEEVLFGYRRFGDASISGRVYLDLDGDGRYNPEIDTPVGGLSVSLETLNGEPVATKTSSPQGNYLFSELNSGQYRLILSPPPTGYTVNLEQIVSVPFSDVSVTANYPLLPNDQQPRVLVFLDSNSNDAPDVAEQRLGGVTVTLYDAPCGAAQTPVATAVTNSSGLATFHSVLNNAVGCARVSQLAQGTAAVHPNGVSVLRSGIPAWLPVQTLGSLIVQPFHDLNGNGGWDTGEPILSSFTVTANGQQLTTGPNGAAFNLGAGTVTVNVTPAAGYQVMVGLPVTTVVNQGAATTLRLPVQVSGGIHGQVQTSGSSAGWAGLTVELRHLTSNETRLAITSSTGCQSSTCWTAGNFSFHNVSPGPYRLRLLDVPPGYLPGAEPLVNYSAGQSVQQNLVVYPAGAVNGLVYYDANFNGVKGSAEQGSNEFSLTLINDAGLPTATIQPAANGTFSLSGLQANVQYALALNSTAASGNVGVAITQSPGWFTLSSQPLNLQIGYYHVPVTSGTETKNRYYGQVFTGPLYNRTPLAGATIIAYPWQNTTPAAAGCNQSNPPIFGEGYSDNSGNYWLFAGPISYNTYFCLRVVDTPGVTQDQVYIVPGYGGWPTAGGFFLQSGVVQKDLQLTVNSQPSMVNRQQPIPHVSLTWTAFRDDNGNGTWDAGELALSGAELRIHGLTAVSGPNGFGELSGLPDGTHLLTITPPPGYAVVGSTERTLFVNGADVILPPIAFRVSGAFIGTVFADNDGDGRQGSSGNERGIGGVTVQINGPVLETVVSDLSGRFHLHGLPDGTYTLTVTPSDGYAPLPPQTVTLTDGGLIGLPLQPVGPVVGVIYEDWDGDGRRGADEPLLQSAISVTLGTAAETVLTAGQFLFWEPNPGSYEVDAIWTGIAPQTITVGPDTGNGLALAAVDIGTVRGTIWHDTNGDGIRQPWETPLTGVTVTIEAQTVTTDPHGRFLFINVAPGRYSFTVTLPDGLTTDVATVVVEEDRGTAVGIGAIAELSQQDFRVLLPLIAR
ncbi:SdrD B-like domain-containing protein [Candidatus Chloroploca asiatica]|nr:SdrD B-like domain-containing protein [Candidatus Chloroploca asiatica]